MRASYFLKHKDVCVAQVVFDTQTGNMAECSKLYEQNCLPVFCAGIQERLKQWWQDRAVPKNQSNIQALLRENDIASTQSFLLNNLGLSLIDAYWVCPVNLDVSWKQVSLFQNHFSESIEEAVSNTKTSPFIDENGVFQFTPAASSGGELKKMWVKKDGDVYLMKGNREGISFIQSLNEVFISKLYDHTQLPHVKYKMIKFKDGSNGCIAPAYTNEKTEFISAWEIEQNIPDNHKNSRIEQFIGWVEKQCGVRIRDFINTQAVMDYIVSNTDRHLNNFGLLRDSDTLEYIGAAPVFDNGNSMLFRMLQKRVVYREVINQKTYAFYPNEKAIIDNLSNIPDIDVSAFPSAEEVQHFYMQDPALYLFAKEIAAVYEVKRDMYGKLLEGKSFNTARNELIAMTLTFPDTIVENYLTGKNGNERHQ